MSARPFPSNGDRVRRALFPSFQLERAEAVAAGPALPEPRALESSPRAPRDEQADALRQRVRADAFEIGLREGRAAARAETNARLQALAASLEAAGRALLARRVDLAAAVDQHLPRLVILLCRKVIHAELAAAGTAVHTVIRGITERLAGCDRPVTVRLDPRTAEAVEEVRRAAPAEFPLGPTIRLEPDPTLGPGDCTLETSDGFLDGRIDSQLEEAWRLLAELPE